MCHEIGWLKVLTVASRVVGRLWHDHLCGLGRWGTLWAWVTGMGRICSLTHHPATLSTWTSPACLTRYVILQTLLTSML